MARWFCFPYFPRFPRFPRFPCFPSCCCCCGGGGGCCGAGVRDFILSIQHVGVISQKTPLKVRGRLSSEAEMSRAATTEYLESRKPFERVPEAAS